MCVSDFTYITELQNWYTEGLEFNFRFKCESDIGNGIDQAVCIVNGIVYEESV